MFSFLVVGDFVVGTVFKVVILVGAGVNDLVSGERGFAFLVMGETVPRKKG